MEGRQAGGVEVDREQTPKWRAGVGPVLNVESHRFLYVSGSPVKLNFMYLSLSVFNIIFSTYSLTHDCT